MADEISFQQLAATVTFTTTGSAKFNTRTGSGNINVYILDAMYIVR